MKQDKLRHLIFLALCCDLGLFTKRLIAPVANILTDSLHIPGGIGTSFSLMFLVIAAVLLPRFGCATLMGAVQSAIALSLGMVGSMGILSPIGYIVPSFVIDCMIYISRRCGLNDELTTLSANMLAAASASLTANLLVFHLSGVVLLLYVSVALTSGAICGMLGGSLALRLRPIICTEIRKDKENETEKNYDRNYRCPCDTDSNTGACSL